ncbi:hypothetical protein BDZ89DRAFT_254771 [Hymenopellis radicata]|nr:hypothetical protein BDZ89DRAFT_254771 [Hymenopellis radicata]
MSIPPWSPYRISMGPDRRTMSTMSASEKGLGEARRTFLRFKRHVLQAGHCEQSDKQYQRHATPRETFLFVFSGADGGFILPRSPWGNKRGEGPGYELFLLILPRVSSQ